MDTLLSGVSDMDGDDDSHTLVVGDFESKADLDDERVLVLCGENDEVTVDVSTAD
jgi:hypothetical protein